MKLLDRRKATTVRKKREPSRERRTILRLASLLSRRMVAVCMLGEYGNSVSTPAPILILCNHEAGCKEVEIEDK